MISETDFTIMLDNPEPNTFPERIYKFGCHLLTSEIAEDEQAADAD